MCSVTQGNAVIVRYLFNFMAKTSWSLGSANGAEFKGFGWSNQTYPKGAILDMWVNSEENMRKLKLQLQSQKNNQPSPKGLIRKRFGYKRHVAKQGVSPCTSFFLWEIEMQNDFFQQRFPSERIKEKGGTRASWQRHFLLLLKWDP